MKYLLWALVLFLAFAVQGSISLFEVKPNLTAVLACYAGIQRGEVKGMLIGSLIGIIEDSLSGAFLGPNLLGKSLVGYLSAFIYRRLFIWTPVLGVLIVCILTLTDGLVVFLSRSVFDRVPAGFGAAAFIILLQSIFNAPFGILLKKKSETAEHPWYR
jgi:rod shape-determining protein MreD